ncbi:putative rho guanine nucleotide exchange factor 39 [Apostichopus japonicus]|uniref:Putative rho guanine nucleotide exchange factor 39 n=1 Tax=Stichopus japonicus TaxID=307972 RepID=A0A2G8JTG0_STIJA|nr:putative rho guanine nucleotide exchange factor 39 [Apostichopus japonicus]
MDSPRRLMDSPRRLMDSPRRLSARLSASGKGLKGRLSSASKSQPGKDTIKRDLEKFLQQKVIHSNKFYRKREKIVTEIFSSERRYQEQLKVVVDLFMTPLRARGILPDQVFRTIFGDLTAIQSVNKELLAHMEETSIGTAFLQLAPYMRLYCTYANDFDRAMLTLQVGRYCT